ncbi:MAG: bestrophin family protein [Flavobacteriales bacterium]|nr:bestrophin family protein [Flavobacteriales bacterium]
MIAYNPREWFSQITRFHKADTVRQLAPTMIILAAVTAIVVILEHYFIHVKADGRLSKMSVMYGFLGFVISLLLVFRTNTAYERWWEGRKLWGALVNCSRNLAIKVNAVLGNVHETSRQRLIEHIIHFPYALKNHLRNVTTMNEQELAELFKMVDFKNKKHIPLQISQSFYEELLKLHREGKINGEQLLIINQEAQQWMEICGACERIRNTPIPYSYSTFLKKFIFIYVITMPFIYGPVLMYFAIPLVVFIFYVLASLEIIAEEIENPFGTDANDLPLDEISKNIRNAVELISNSPHHAG